MIVCKEGGGVPWSLGSEGKQKSDYTQGSKGDERGEKKGQILFSPLPQKINVLKSLYFIVATEEGAVEWRET